ncbi:hypothetical protein JW964_04880 [candidate division KSB1 bacterium]|nr:hypothetical protein [candidate division KSB1 bacterium]
MEPRAKARGSSIVTCLNSYSYKINLTAMVPRVDQICHFRMFTRQKHSSTGLAGIHTFSDQWMSDNPLANGRT